MKNIPDVKSVLEVIEEAVVDTENFDWSVSDSEFESILEFVQKYTTMDRHMGATFVLTEEQQREVVMCSPNGLSFIIDPCQDAIRLHEIKWKL